MKNIYWKHFKTIIKHKYYVALECFKIWLYWQWLVHDLSKFSPTEFFISAKYFQWNSSPIDKERLEKWYSIAWLNHKAKNKHHQHYWVDFTRWQVIPVEMPRKYLLEMACDFIGAGKAYNNTTSDLWEPLKYWNEKIDKTYIHPNTIMDFEYILINYKNNWKLLW